MRIAVFHNLPSGGAKRALYGLVKYLSRMGNEIDVFIPSTANENFLPLNHFAKKITMLPVRKSLIGLIKSSVKYVVPIGGYSISIADLEKTQKQLAKLIDQGQYDVAFLEQDQFTWSPFVLKYLDTPQLYYCQQPVRSNEAIYDNLQRITALPMRKIIWRRYLRMRLTRIDQENASFAQLILANSYFSRESILKAYGKNSYVSYRNRP